MGCRCLMFSKYILLDREMTAWGISISGRLLCAFNMLNINTYVLGRSSPLLKVSLTWDVAWNFIAEI